MLERPIPCRPTPGSRHAKTPRSCARRGGHRGEHEQCYVMCAVVVEAPRANQHTLPAGERSMRTAHRAGSAAGQGRRKSLELQLQ